MYAIELAIKTATDTFKAASKRVIQYITEATVFLILKKFEDTITVTAQKAIFSRLEISWKAQKNQVNIIFPLTFWIKKDHISHLRKVQNKSCLVTSKYHFFHQILGSKKTVFPSPESSEQEPFSNQ